MTAAPTSSVLDDRYGRRPRRRGWWIAAGIVVAALLGWYAWSMFTAAGDSVDVDGTGYHVVDAHSVTVDFQVTLRQGAPVACALEAQDVEHGVVGYTVVSYPADAAHSRHFSETIPTVAEATTGLVTSCWIP